MITRTRVTRVARLACAHDYFYLGMIVLFGWWLAVRTANRWSDAEKCKLQSHNYAREKRFSFFSSPLFARNVLITGNVKFGCGCKQRTTHWATIKWIKSRQSDRDSWRVASRSGLVSKTHLHHVHLHPTFSSFLFHNHNSLHFRKRFHVCVINDDSSNTITLQVSEKHQPLCIILTAASHICVTW